MLWLFVWEKSHSLEVSNVVDYTSYREELFTLGWNSLGIVESVTKTHKCMHRRGWYYSLILQCARGKEEGFSVMLSSVHTERSCWHQLLIASLTSAPPSIWKLINNVCSAPHSTQLHCKDQNYRKKLTRLKFSFTQGIFLALSQVITPMKGSCS